MLISKSYLKQIIKESINEVLNKPIGYEINYTAKISPEKFLRLNTPRGEYKIIQQFLKEAKQIKNFELLKSTYQNKNLDMDKVANQIIIRALNIQEPNVYKISPPFISINIAAWIKVVNHEGRARTLRGMIENAINKKRDELMMIYINVEPTSLEDLEHSLESNKDERNLNIKIHGQFKTGYEIIELNDLSDIKRK